MLSEDMQIRQLPVNIATQLRRVGDFFVCSSFTEDVIGPRIIKIGESIYYRFMKFIYLPQLPEKLYPEQVIEVCNFRLDYLAELLDYKLNSHIVSTMAKRILSTSTNISSRLKVLDFGCGSGLSSQLLLEHIPNSEIVGVDISEKAVFHSQKQGLAAFLTFPGGPLPFESATFDLIFAVFVMHFKVDVPTLVELQRVLRPSGQFVFNFRERDTGEIIEQPYVRNIDGIIRQLEESGFCSIGILKHIDGICPNHIIISCRSQSFHETIFHQMSRESQENKYRVSI